MFDKFMDGKQIEVFTLELAVKANLQPGINGAFFHMLSWNKTDAYRQIIRKAESSTLHFVTSTWEI